MPLTLHYKMKLGDELRGKRAELAGYLSWFDEMPQDRDERFAKAAVTSAMVYLGDALTFLGEEAS